MPLSAPVKRRHYHTREVRCLGFEREDGLWDIEGRITDTKTYSFENHDRGTVGSGAAVHDMLVRLTIDDGLVVHEAEATTESSPFAICPNVTASISELKGLKIGAGWTLAVHELIGRTAGCTHIAPIGNGSVGDHSLPDHHPSKNAHRPRRPGSQAPAESPRYLLCFCERRTGRKTPVARPLYRRLGYRPRNRICRYLQNLGDVECRGWLAFDPKIDAGTAGPARTRGDPKIINHEYPNCRGPARLIAMFLHRVANFMTANSLATANFLQTVPDRGFEAQARPPT